jgi:MFS transporter, Spinster family, sphingosine-1-phosphate transporter
VSFSISAITSRLKIRTRLSIGLSLSWFQLGWLNTMTTTESYAARNNTPFLSSPFRGLSENNHLSLFLILALGVVSMMDSMIVGSLLTPIKAEFGFSDEQLGRLSSLFTIAGIIGAPVFGYFSNRYSRKAVLLTGVLIWSIASLSTGTATGFLGLVSWRIATGFGEAAYNSIAPSWLADLYRPRWRNLVFSLYMIKNKIGTAAALALGGWVAAEYGWRTAFFVAGLPGILLAVALGLTREPSIGATDEPATSEGKSHPTGKLSIRESLAVFRHPAYVLHLIALFFFYTAMTVQIWIPAFIHRAYDIPNKTASGFLAQTLLFTLPAGLVGGYLSSLLLQRYRWGFPAFLASTSVLAAAAFFQAYATSDLETAKLFIIIGTATFGFSAGTLTTLVVETVPAYLRSSATAISIVLTSGLAGIVSPELVGFLSDSYSLQTAIFVGPISYLIAGFVWVIFALLAKRRTNETSNT